VIGDPAKVSPVGVRANTGFWPAGTSHAARLKFVQQLDVVYWMPAICSAYSDTPARPSPGGSDASV
jgi:hypothetical protein